MTLKNHLIAAGLTFATLSATLAQTAETKETPKAEAKAEATWTPIFNGKDLDGWTSSPSTTPNGKLSKANLATFFTKPPTPTTTSVALIASSASKSKAAPNGRSATTGSCSIAKILKP